MRHRTTRRTTGPLSLRVGALALAGALALSGCGGADPDPAASGPGPDDPGATTEPAAPAETPGAAMDVPFADGARLSVVGVAHDGRLDVLSDPDPAAAVVATLPALGKVVTTGRGWSPSWVEVVVEGQTGWAQVGSLAGRAGTDDVTAEVVRRLGERPRARSLPALGRLVAGARSSVDPPSSVVMSVAPSLGDLGEVTFDVVGLGDDSVWAERLHVFAQRLPGGKFSLGSVEATSFCARGAPTGDLCP